ncbi:unnamed protein product [Calypogeia fissa]
MARPAWPNQHLLELGQARLPNAGTVRPQASTRRPPALARRLGPGRAGQGMLPNSRRAERARPVSGLGVRAVRAEPQNSFITQERRRVVELLVRNILQFLL